MNMPMRLLAIRSSSFRFELPQGARKSEPPAFLNYNLAAAIKSPFLYSSSVILKTTGFFESEQEMRATPGSDSQGNRPPYFSVKRAGVIS